jgi:putative DNA primase/helicase
LPEVQRHKAALDAWMAEREGVLAKIKQLSRDGKRTDKERAELAELQHKEPVAPRVPTVVLADETPENLAWSLARRWPSSGIASSEAGSVFGAHGMGNDSVMRYLALLNILWDGGTHKIGRKTSENFTVRGARLTVALQVQEATLRSFFDKSHGLARGTGFLARFLVAWPESTQGGRLFKEAPAHWPHLAAFNRKVADILAMSVPMGSDGTLSPALMTLTPEAKAAWIDYHDAIERELACGGELYDVRDVASKSADNAVRLAALFHAFQYGLTGSIGRESMLGASRVAAWHLNESRRFFGELALPVEMADAARLDAFLARRCRQLGTTSLSTHDVQKNGPLRDRNKRV